MLLARAVHAASRLGPRVASAAPLANVHARRWLAADDSHDDFKPQRKPPPTESAGDVEQRIRGYVEEAPLVVFMKGVPDMPQCGFSGRVVQILRAEGVQDIKSYNVLADPELREGIKKYSSWPTIPQVYIGGEFQGGSDTLLEMYQSGELSAALKEAGVAVVEE